MAGEYLFLGGRHDILSLCDRDGAIARASHRGLLVCQNGVWRSAGAGGGGFSTNSMHGCQAPNGSSTVNPVTGMCGCPTGYSRSEEHTSELQSLMRISYAVF